MWGCWCLVGSGGVWWCLSGPFVVLSCCLLVCSVCSGDAGKSGRSTCARQSLVPSRSLQDLVGMFHLLKYGLSVILVFIGLQLVLSPYLHLSASAVCVLILAIFGVSVVGSCLSSPPSGGNSAVEAPQAFHLTGRMSRGRRVGTDRLMCRGWRANSARVGLGKLSVTRRVAGRPWTGEQRGRSRGMRQETSRPPSQPFSIVPSVALSGRFRRSALREDFVPRDPSSKPSRAAMCGDYSRRNPCQTCA